MYFKILIKVYHGIKKAILKQIKHGIYKKSKLYGDGNAAVKIHDILVTADLNINKSLVYLKNE